MWMEFIALFAPAVITLSVRYRKNNGTAWEWFRYVREYITALLVNVWSTQAVIVYVLRATGEESGDFVRFVFMIKYLLIACVLAFITSYIWEGLAKALSVSAQFEERSNRDK